MPLGRGHEIESDPWECQQDRRDIAVLSFSSLRWPFVLGVAGGCVWAVIGVAVLRSGNVLANTSSPEPSAYGLSIVVLLFTASVATLLPAIRVRAVNHGRPCETTKTWRPS